jgi:hypothetical protein
MSKMVFTTVRGAKSAAGKRGWQNAVIAETTTGHYKPVPIVSEKGISNLKTMEPQHYIVGIRYNGRWRY